MSHDIFLKNTQVITIMTTKRKVFSLIRRVSRCLDENGLVIFFDTLHTAVLALIISRLMSKLEMDSSTGVIAEKFLLEPIYIIPTWDLLINLID